MAQIKKLLNPKDDWWRTVLYSIVKKYKNRAGRLYLKKEDLVWPPPERGVVYNQMADGRSWLELG